MGILRAVLHSLTAESESVFITRVIACCDSHVTGRRLPGSGCLTGFSSKSRHETSAKISDTDVTSLVSFPVEETSKSLFVTAAAVNGL